MSLEQKYKNLVNSKCVSYGWNLTNHTKNVMVSMLMTRDKVWNGGGVEQAILNNNLGDTTKKADDEINHCLKQMVIARDYFFLEQLEEFNNI